jgi:YHS domain-containing protein
MKSCLKSLAMALALSLTASCSTPKTESQDGSVATCHVCRYRNDLACVRIKVKDSTPRAEYQGATYYFCSEDCREEFLKNPQMYLPRAQKP